MARYRVRLRVTDGDRDAILLRLCSVLHSRRVTVHTLAYQREGASQARLSIELEPTNCGIDTVRWSLQRVIGVSVDGAPRVVALAPD